MVNVYETGKWDVLLLMKRSPQSSERDIFFWHDVFSIPTCPSDFYKTFTINACAVSTLALLWGYIYLLFVNKPISLKSQLLVV